MKKVSFLFFIFSFILNFSQDSKLYYSGYLYENNKNNKPLQFQKILNKTSKVYEYTDQEGFLIIEAKIGDTLTWNSGKNIIKVNSVNELKKNLKNNTTFTYSTNIISNEYNNLISKTDSLSSFNINKHSAKLSKKSNFNFYGNEVRKIEKDKDTLFTVKRVKNQLITINGNLSSFVEVKMTNAKVHLQNSFVQGRSENGILVWKGPETSELFSFGPLISDLGFDGISYPYDENGSLVPFQFSKNSATKYDNNLLKPLLKFSNFLNLNSFYKIDGNQVIGLNLKFGQSNDPLYFVDQFSKNNQLSAKLNVRINDFKINVGYQYSGNKATNSNRVGLFNRIYENSLLSPISFSNRQNAFLDNGLQRSFSLLNDNPLFLLSQDDQFSAQTKQHIFSAGLEKKLFNDFNINISGSQENFEQSNLDQYKPSTAFFINGINNFRINNYDGKNANISLDYDFGDYDFKNQFFARFIYNDKKVAISNSLDNSNYNYRRITKEFVLEYQPSIDLDWIIFDFFLGNSFYSSSTTDKNRNWLPKVNGKIIFKNIFNTRAELNLLGGYEKSTDEISITNSFSSYQLTNISASNSFSYFPTKEVSSYNQIKNIDKNSYNLGLIFKPIYRVIFKAEYFNKKIINDVFPIFYGTDLLLRNMADHIYDGFDFSLEFNQIVRNRNFNFWSKLSFFKYSDVVNKVFDNYNNHPIVGFFNIYKGIVEGESLGNIYGSYYLKNSSEKLIIGSDGFPIKSTGLKNLGNSIPNFTMKLNNALKYKNIELNIDWEWRNGGKIWNGTQAALDYYGRSENSAKERNVKGYLYDGVDASGNTNLQIVDFYNPNLPISENRWVRYGMDGVAEDYIENGDYVKINNISISTWFKVPNYYNKLKITGYISNLFIWKKYHGVDPTQSFYNEGNGQGLDFFNLPNYTGYGVNVSFEF